MLNHNTLSLTTLKVATNLFRCFKCNELCNSSARLQPPNNTLKPQRANDVIAARFYSKILKNLHLTSFKMLCQGIRHYLAGTKE